MIECICINDSYKPRIIPSNKWVKLGEKYHITHIGTTIGTNIPSCTLKEISLSKENYPYQGFRLDRFAIRKDKLHELIELIKNCSELNNLEIPQPKTYETIKETSSI